MQLSQLVLIDRIRNRRQDRPACVVEPVYRVTARVEATEDQQQRPRSVDAVRRVLDLEGNHEAAGGDQSHVLHDVALLDALCNDLGTGEAADPLDDRRLRIAYPQEGDARHEQCRCDQQQRGDRDHRKAEHAA